MNKKSLGLKQMNLVERAIKLAKENGKKIDPGVLRGLKGIQAMHDLTKKGKGSPYEIYISSQE